VSAADTPLLDVRGLTVLHGKVEAVRSVDVQVGRGRIATVIGPNGAGKTTLLSAIAGLLPAAGGRVTLDGERIDGAAVEENVARGLALVPETRELFAGMSVDDNLLLGAFSRRRAGRRERDAQRLRAVEPEQRRRVELGLADGVGTVADVALDVAAQAG
jgi:branched-chain amino acid transport system ATP-binding protein